MVTTSSSPTTYIQDTTALFKIWAIKDIWAFGSTGRYVPNVGDWVIDPVQGIMVVLAIDASSKFSTLVPVNLPVSSNTVGDEDVLLGSGPGVQTEAYRAYLDTSKLPYDLSPDSKLYMNGSTVTGYKVFLGTDVTENGTVISKYYDQSGNFIDELVPMETVQNAVGNNVAVRTPVPCSTLQQMANGEIVTYVFYDAVSGPRSFAQLQVINTAAIRKISSAMKYIASIDLVSTFLSTTEPTVLQFPVNMPVSSIPVMGRVTYSDGTSKLLPIDGSVFQLTGLKNFVASTVGQEAPLVLLYTPTDGEAAYGVSAAPNKKISAMYTARTTQLDGNYSVKLYGFPRWVSANAGYVMEYYLYTLDRSQVYYVTPYVTNNLNATPFNGLTYAAVQQLSLKVNLNSVDPATFKNVSFVTTLAVTLNGPGSGPSDLWNVQFSPNQNPAYGGALAANLTYQAVDNWLLDITCGQTSQQQWLNALYSLSEPLVNPDAETLPPAPNFFALVFPTGSIEVPVAQWNATMQVANTLGQGQLLYVKFFFRSSAGDQQLSIAALPVMIQQTVQV